MKSDAETITPMLPNVSTLSIVRELLFDTSIPVPVAPPSTVIPLATTSIPSASTPCPLSPAVKDAPLLSVKSPEVFRTPVSNPEITVPERTTGAP